MRDDPEEREELLASLRLLDTPGHLLRRNHQRSYEIFSALVGDDVTRQQMALLIALYQNPGAAQNRLVGLTGFDKATIAEMLGRMVARGWVSRSRDPQDGRAWTMHVTDAGRTMLLDRIPFVMAAQDEILAPLPADMRPIFLHCLRMLLGLAPVEDGANEPG
ncbi:MAG TPA: MarR family winged helix-turn-helix transcriptional regulator [Sphingopyxis sp.]|nr:MarR family winged helix-turn-helix transcriptional regulator [Sphingopyxis sp.]HMP43693.1 MarR family winged helix-turn-helix transcriptional regulator [Sphingopyxis sp.]HMQ17655.1 MarR family winged helix-turn-helix transcriptional regulator [Sphingopyxis sp.]